MAINVVSAGTVGPPGPPGPAGSGSERVGYAAIPRPAFTGDDSRGVMYPMSAFDVSRPAGEEVKYLTDQAGYENVRSELLGWQPGPTFSPDGIDGAPGLLFASGDKSYASILGSDNGSRNTTVLFYPTGDEWCLMIPAGSGDEDLLWVAQNDTEFFVSNGDNSIAYTQAPLAANELHAFTFVTYSDHSCLIQVDCITLAGQDFLFSGELVGEDWELYPTFTPLISNGIAGGDDVLVGTILLWDAESADEEYETDYQLELINDYCIACGVVLVEDAP